MEREDIADGDATYLNRRLVLPRRSITPPPLGSSGLGGPPGMLGPPIPLPRCASYAASTSPYRLVQNSRMQLSVSYPSIASPEGSSVASTESKASKYRQKKFRRHFKNVTTEEIVLNTYSCALIGDILLQGHLYITHNYFAFYSNVFGYITKVVIPVKTVGRVSKEKTAKIFPNAVGVVLSPEGKKYVFGSLLSRDTTYKLMVRVWKCIHELPPSPPLTLHEESMSEEEPGEEEEEEDDGLVFQQSGESEENRGTTPSSDTPPNTPTPIGFGISETKEPGRGLFFVFLILCLALVGSTCLLYHRFYRLQQLFVTKERSLWEENASMSMQGDELHHAIHSQIYGLIQVRRSLDSLLSVYSKE